MSWDNWDTELFDISNGDRRSLDDIEADYWDDLGNDGYYDDPWTNYDRSREI